MWVSRELREPHLPFVPEVRQVVEPADRLIPDQQLDRIGRRAGSGRETGHRRFPPGERAVDGGEVRDQEGEDEEADPRLDERDHVAPLAAARGGRTKPSVNSDEPLISNASAQPSKTGAEHEREPHEHEQDPHHHEPDERGRCVERHRPDRAPRRCSAASRRPEHSTSVRNTNRVTNDDAPRGSTNVRTAESTTAPMMKTPASTSRTSPTCSHTSIADRSNQSSGSGGRRLALDLAAAALLLQPLGRRRRTRPGRSRAPVSTCRARRRASTAGARARARGSALATCVGGDRGDDGAEPVEEPVALAWTRGRRTRRPGTRPRPGCRWYWRAARPDRPSGSPASRAPRGECDTSRVTCSHPSSATCAR